MIKQVYVVECESDVALFEKPEKAAELFVLLYGDEEGFVAYSGYKMIDVNGVIKRLQTNDNAFVVDVNSCKSVYRKVVM